MAKIFGLQSVLMGAPAADGGMGLALTEVLGLTVKGTASLTSTEPTTTDIETEEVDTLLDSLTTAQGVWSLKASTYNVSAATMQKFFGGTVTGTAPTQTWAAPAGGASVDVYQSVQATTRNGHVFSFVKMKLTAAANMSFDKTKLGQIDWTGKLLTPDKAATPPMTVAFATV